MLLLPEIRIMYNRPSIIQNCARRRPVCWIQTPAAYRHRSLACSGTWWSTVARTVRRPRSAVRQLRLGPDPGTTSGGRMTPTKCKYQKCKYQLRTLQHSSSIRTISSETLYSAAVIGCEDTQASPLPRTLEMERLQHVRFNYSAVGRV